MKIVVLAGGLSPERNVSLSSGAMVCEALRSKGHQVALVDLFFGMEGTDQTVDPFQAPIPQAFKKVSPQAPDPGAGAGQPQRPEPFSHRSRGAGTVRRGGCGLSGSPRGLRRGRTHPGRSGPAGGALHRLQLPQLRHRYGQGYDQAPGGRSGAHPPLADGDRHSGPIWTS